MRESERARHLIYDWQIALCSWMLELTARRFKMYEDDLEEAFDFIRVWYQDLQGAL